MLNKLLRWALSKPRLSAFVVVLILSAGAWTVLYEVMDGRVERAKAQLRERGRPVLPEDLNREPVADELNPAPLYIQAGGMVVAYAATQPTLSGNPVYPFDGAWVKAAQDAESALTPAFNLVAQASRLPPGRINTHYKSPLMNLMLPNLGPSKQIARALNDNACLKSIQGDSKGALNRIHDILDVERSTTNEPTLVSGLVSIGEWCLAAEAALSIAPSLKSEDLPRTRETIKRLIGRFLDESSRNEKMVQAFGGERVFDFELADTYYKKIWIGKPVRFGGELMINKEIDELERIITAPDWQARVEMIDGRFVQSDPRSSIYAIMPALGAVVDRHFRGLGQTRSAATSLAIHLYRMEHDGKLPESLDDLVPGYLPAVPKDPYSQKPLGYRIFKDSLPGGGDRPVLFYNIDAVDQGPDPKMPSYDWSNLGVSRDIRQYRDLAGFKPVLSPVQEPDDSHPQQADDAGDEEEPEKGAPDEGPDQPGNGNE